MKQVRATLINNETKLRTCQVFELKEEPDINAIIFQWTQGNFACDCNRAIFALDKDESCGNTRYTLLSIELITRPCEFGGTRVETIFSNII